MSRNSSAISQVSYNGLINPCNLGVDAADAPSIEWILRVDLMGRVLNEIPVNQVFIEISSTGQTRKRIVLP
ncbi:MAG: hypothetical protein ACKO68_00145 [Bacteroidota bacterium]